MIKLSKPCRLIWGGFLSLCAFLGDISRCGYLHKVQCPCRIRQTNESITSPILFLCGEPDSSKVINLERAKLSHWYGSLEKSANTSLILLATTASLSAGSQRHQVHWWTGKSKFFSVRNEWWDHLVIYVPLGSGHSVAVSKAIWQKLFYLATVEEETENKSIPLVLLRYFYHHQLLLFLLVIIRTIVQV